MLTKLDVRQFEPKKVPADVKLKILEAARASGTGINKQHWRFILVQDRETIKKLAEDSTSGGWVAGANFAVIVLADPQLGFHLIDSGRAVQDMQLAAWDQGVISGLYTGFKEDRMRRDFAIPNELKPTVVVGFGYPTVKILGKKNRRPLSELAFVDKYGNKFDSKKLN
ncbi:MAG TPA: nitroreductase family protein [Candidatus Bathyarchaeia archaeon]